MAHPNSRFTTTLANVPNIAEDFDAAATAAVNAIFRRPHRDRGRWFAPSTTWPRVYDGLTLGAEATSAADGMEGVLRYDPMSMRRSWPTARATTQQHYLDADWRVTEQPIFAHVNWFQRNQEDGHFLWPGYRDNLRPLLWLLQLPATAR